MSIDPRRRDAIEAAIAAYNDVADRRARLTPTAVRLLITMFSSGDACRRSLQDLLSEGFDKGTIARWVRRLIEAGFMSKERGVGHHPNVYRLHLPPVRP